MKVTIQKMIKAQSDRENKKIKEIKMLVNKRLRSNKKSQKKLSKNEKNSSLTKKKH